VSTQGGLVVCHHTLSGADVRSPSPLPFAARVAAAAAAGFVGMGLMWLDYVHMLGRGQSPAELRSVVDDQGIELSEVEFLNDWWANDEPDAAAAAHERLVMEMAEVFGSSRLNVGASVVTADAPGHDVLTERFAKLCGRAADHGLVVGLEFMPFFVLNDAPSAWRVVRDSAAPNAGLVVDAYHWARGGGDLEGLRMVPGDRVVSVQLSDGPAIPAMPIIEETLDHRLLPGAGDFALVELLATLRAMGVEAPIEVEVLNAELRTRTVQRAAFEAFAATQAVLVAVSA
jgi:sugar phosphate isomerase/epimerase